MCFSLFKRDCRSTLVAQKDIVCYKELKRSGRKLFSAFIGSRYELGIVYRKTRTEFLEFKPSNSGSGQGFHSYSKPRMSMYHVNVECVIPKGSRFYYSKYHNEYFSQAIKIVRVIGKREKTPEAQEIEIYGKVLC